MRLPKILKSVPACAFLLSVLSCSSLRVHTAEDPKVDLSKFKTYAWAPRISEKQGTPPTLADQVVKSSIEQQLADKGVQLATNGSPDLLVSYYGVSQQKVNYSAAPDYGYPMYSYYGTTYVT